MANYWGSDYEQPWNLYRYFRASGLRLEHGATVRDPNPKTVTDHFGDIVCLVQTAPNGNLVFASTAGRGITPSGSVNNLIRDGKVKEITQADAMNEIDLFFDRSTYEWYPKPR